MGYIFNSMMRDYERNRNKRLKAVENQRAEKSAAAYLNRLIAARLAAEQQQAFPDGPHLRPGLQGLPQVLRPVIHREGDDHASGFISSAAISMPSTMEMLTFSNTANPAV